LSQFVALYDLRENSSYRKIIGIDDSVSRSYGSRMMRVSGGVLQPQPRRFAGSRQTAVESMPLPIKHDGTLDGFDLRGLQTLRLPASAT